MLILDKNVLYQDSPFLLPEVQKITPERDPYGGSQNPFIMNPCVGDSREHGQVPAGVW